MMVVIQWTYVDGECCSSAARQGYDYHTNLYYGKKHYPCDSYCCGCGACNIFCCNCADGCKKGWWDVWRGTKWTKGKTFRCERERKKNWGKPRFYDPHKREINSYYSNSKELELFNEVDADGSRNLTIDEADQYLKSQSQYKRDTKFSLKDEIEKVDTNEDGIISPFEFDSSLDF